MLIATAVLASATIALSAPAQAATETTPTIVRFDPNVSTFYPTVRDGFRDGVTFRLRTEWVPSAVHWNIEVRNMDGRVVGEHSGRNPDWGASWTWSGRNRWTGNPVGVGGYNAVLTAVNADTGESDTARVHIIATSDTVVRRLTKHLNGNQRGSASHSPSCYVRPWSYDGTLDLDCWGGRFASAGYGFRIPADASNIDWAVGGRVGCCSRGQISKTGTRTSATRYVVRVRVTFWRAFTVNGVNLTYSTHVRR